MLAQIPQLETVTEMATIIVLPGDGRLVTVIVQQVDQYLT